MTSKTKNPRLQAALKLAASGYKIFPVPPGSKQSYVSKNNKRLGSGEAWGMTDDPDLIQKYWKRWPGANVGLPTGAVNNLIVIETDTKAGHANLTEDGEISLKAIERGLGELPDTRMAQSPSGSLHRLYSHPRASLKVKNSSSEIGIGIDVRGDGGMVVAPPSERKDGVYRWLNQKAIAALPAAWVKELTEPVREPPAARQALPEDANWAEQYGAEDEDEAPTFEEVQEALSQIPNEDLNWERWNDVGLRTYAWTSDRKKFLALFDPWCRQSDKYGVKETPEQTFRRYRGSPPTRYTKRSIINLAEYGFDYDGNEPTEESVSWQQGNKNDESEKEPPPHEINGHASAATLGFTDQTKEHILVPYNFWDQYPTPDMIPGLFPKAIERLAVILSEVRGSDAAGLAMGGLLACGAAIPDCYKLQPKPRSDPGWLLDPRIWVAMVGGVASIKTSTVNSIREPFFHINDEMFETYKRQMTRYNELEAADKRSEEEPQCVRIVISDSTSQAAQDIMRYSHDGVLNIQDELGHFFGSLDQFSHSGNTGAERFFWTQSFEGGRYFVDRVNKQRKFMIQNCGMSLFGGIQPEVIRRYGDNSANDGLLQRCLFVMLKKALLDRDTPVPSVQSEYNGLIYQLHKMPRGNIPPLNFTAEAAKVRERFAEKTMHLSDLYSGWSGKLSEHISKWRGLFCRVCLIIHLAETMDDESNIDVDVAERAYQLFIEYLLPHSEAFYLGVLNTTGEIGKLKSVAEFILAHERTEINGRDLQNMIRATRGLTSKDVDLVFQQMFYLSWVTPGEKKRSDSTKWVVNPLVHQLYDAKAEETRRRNEIIRNEILARKESKMHGMVGRER